MSDAIKSRELLKKYSLARIPLITINTIEHGRTLDILKETAIELQLPFYVHTSSKGVYDIVTEKIVNEDKSFYGAIDYMTEQMQRRQYLTIVLTETPDLSSENNESKQILALVNLANESGGVVIIMTNNTVWNQLQRQGLIVKIGLPDEEEMYSIIKEYIDDYRNEITIEWDNSDIREAASALAGVSKIEAENVIAVLIANKCIKKSDMDEIRFAKNRLFSDISGLEKIDVDRSVENVGGLEGLRRWLEEKKELLKPEKRDMLRAKGLQPPRGILLVGVPGCGKSLSAKSIAANWHLPLYRLDFATVQGSYVGQSEQQLKDALTTAENVSPCILWIDEIEKGLSGATGGAGDGGVSTRMVGQFLFWMQECKKQVFVVATANDVSMLPSELLRRGRFDELFFVDLPTADERKDILSLYMKKYLNVDFSGDLADKIIQLTDGFTGADLESTVRDLAYRTIANPNFIMTPEQLITAFNNVVPLSQTSPEKIESIREWGKERAVPASGKPIGGEKLAQSSGVKTRKVLL
ncbi:AAA family ATPase [Selenomonas sp. AB3002]|uniref:AAA family ATPase n=1 Tax=Selenomonas sp. AB3002 TaxID=1392502 RepID=UPI0004975440